MTTYEHRDGESAAAAVTLPGAGTVPVENGEFDVPKEDYPPEEIEAMGHTRVGGDTDDDNTESPDPNLDNLTEEAIVRMDEGQIKSIASERDDLDGRKSAGELEEKLIEKVRD